MTSGQNRSSKERTDHPAQFPIDVIDRIIKASSHQADLILDPFMGSGTTAEAALRNGRKVIGFEVNLAYCNTIANRLENSTVDSVCPHKEIYSKTNQLSLF